MGNAILYRAWLLVSDAASLLRLNGVSLWAAVNAADRVAYDPIEPYECAGDCPFACEKCEADRG